MVPQAKESDLQSWKLLRQFRGRLRPHLAAAAQTRTEQDPRCQLLAEDYFCLLLFGLFNPALRSMRALCHASGRLIKMRKVCSRPMATTSFSEGQHLFEPEILSTMVRELAHEIKGRAEFGDRRLRQAVEGITPGNCCERKVLKSKVQPGAFYVADRLYSDDYAFLGRMLRQKIDFVMRLPGNATRIGGGPDRRLTAHDQAAGVVSDRMEQLGAKHQGLVIRVVEIHAAGQVFVLGTSRQDLPAELIGLSYRYRWQIELFFKWFKMILGSRHWLAESPRGVAIQLYSAMIATLLLTMVTGRRPTIRQLETLHLYFVGFASERELLRELGLQKS